MTGSNGGGLSLIGAIPPKVAAGIVLAQRATQDVMKSAHNSFGHYDYASSDDIINEGRRALNAGELALMPLAHVVAPWPQERPTGITSKGEVVDAPELGLRISYVMVHSSGESVQIESFAPLMIDAAKPPDKAVAAAKTLDLAYTYRALVGIARTPGEGAPSRGEQDGGRDPRRDDPRGGGQRRGPRRDEGPSSRVPTQQHVSAPPAPVGTAQVTREMGEDAEAFARLRERARAATEVLGEAEAVRLVGSFKGRSRAAQAAAVAVLETAVADRKARAKDAEPLDPPAAAVTSSSEPSPSPRPGPVDFDKRAQEQVAARHAAEAGEGTGQ